MLKTNFERLAVPSLMHAFIHQNSLRIVSDCFSTTCVLLYCFGDSDSERPHLDARKKSACLSVVTIIVTIYSFIH